MEEYHSIILLHSDPDKLYYIFYLLHMELQWGMEYLFSTETENTHTDALEK